MEENTEMPQRPEFEWDESATTRIFMMYVKEMQTAYIERESHIEDLEEATIASLRMIYSIMWPIRDINPKGIELFVREAISTDNRAIPRFVQILCAARSRNILADDFDDFVFDHSDQIASWSEFELIKTARD